MRVVYYFTADWCVPCKQTRPIAEDLVRDRSGTKLHIIDVDDNHDLVKKFEIKSVPTFILLENGTELKRVSGKQNKNQLEDFIYG